MPDQTGKLKKTTTSRAKPWRQIYYFFSFGRASTSGSTSDFPIGSKSKLNNVLVPNGQL